MATDVASLPRAELLERYWQLEAVVIVLNRLGDVLPVLDWDDTPSRLNMPEYEALFGGDERDLDEIPDYVVASAKAVALAAEMMMRLADSEEFCLREAQQLAKLLPEHVERVKGLRKAADDA